MLFIIISMYNASYLDTCADIHGHDQDGIKMSEDVLINHEDAGVKPSEEHGEEVTNNKGENQVNACEDKHVTALSDVTLLLNASFLLREK